MRPSTTEEDEVIPVARDQYQPARDRVVQNLTVTRHRPRGIPYEQDFVPGLRQNPTDIGRDVVVDEESHSHLGHLLRDAQVHFALVVLVVRKALIDVRAPEIWICPQSVLDGASRHDHRYDVVDSDSGSLHDRPTGSDSRA